MRALVVGGAGFIGRNLCESLRKRGYSVDYADTFIHGDTQRVNVPPGCTEVEEYDKARYDVAFYLGGLSSAPMFSGWGDVVDCVSDFADFLHTVDTGRIVLASTSSMYSTIPSGEYDVISPRTYYEACKKMFEDMLSVHVAETGRTGAVARLFSVYGPHETHKGRYANLITQMIWAANRGETFEIYGDGSQTRDFTHVSDIVSGLEILGAHPVVSGFEIYNLGTGISHPISEIVEMIPNLKVKYIKNPLKNYVSDTLADNDRATGIGWKAQVDLRRGVEMSIGEYRNG